MDFKIHKIDGEYGCEAYLVISGNDAVMVDTGYSIGIDGIIKNIDELLQGRKLRHIILSHSHYDHVMGAPAISEHFPEAKIYAHPRVAKIFSKPNARKTMEDLNRSAGKGKAADNKDIIADKKWSEKLRVDIDISDGDMIKAGDMVIKVIETPGHTSDSISLYFVNEDLVFASESLGVAVGLPDVVPGFIVSYRDSVESIKKIMAIHPKHMITPHSIMISGGDIDTYLENSLNEADRIHDVVMDANKKGYSVDETIEILKDIYYKGPFKEAQPYDALYANWLPMVTKLIQ